LFTETHRPPVRLDGTVKEPLRLRESLAALYAVVASDFRYVPKNRTAYLAYLRLRRETAGLRARQAQQTFFVWVLRHDPLAFILLDPLITVHPDRVLFEVFSKDEGSYAQLAVEHTAFDLDGPLVCGTTNVDFSQALFAGVEQMRSYRTTRLTVGREEIKLATAAAGEVLEKRVRVPDSWLRGFLPGQSAATVRRD